jgi:hypothetical protein
MARQLAIAVTSGLILIAACATPQADPVPQGAQAGAAAQLACTPSPRMPVADRASPYDSASFQVGTTTGKICYGRPRAAGRTMIGGEAVPYGRLWRTGANEPTIVHLTGPATIGGVAVAAGSYSLYTIPETGDWTIIVNRATAQWGHESQYTEAIQAQEVGRAAVASTRVDDHVEQFTIRPVQQGPAHVDLLLEWERTRVTIPVRAGR